MNNTANAKPLSDALPFASEDERKVPIAGHSGLLLIACAIGLTGNWVATGVTPIAAAPGMAVLYVLCVAGLVLARTMPFYLPRIAWASLLAIVATLPGVPGAAWVTEQVGALNFLALATPALAYGGLALTQNEFAIARRSGWKIVVVAICVMFGTFIGSVIIADLALRVTGQ